MPLWDCNIINDGCFGLRYETRIINLDSQTVTIVTVYVHYLWLIIAHYAWRMQACVDPYVSHRSADTYACHKQAHINLCVLHGGTYVPTRITRRAIYTNASHTSHTPMGITRRPIYANAYYRQAHIDQYVIDPALYRPISISNFIDETSGTKRLDQILGNKRQGAHVSD